MPGKSRYGGGMSSASRYDTAAEDTRSTAPTTAATVATAAAVQASWAQYVQDLVSSPPGLAGPSAHETLLFYGVGTA
jgi:hypothetical protein